MRKKIFKTFLFILVLAIGVSTVVINLNALMDRACRGTDNCSDIYDACMDSSEIAYIINQGSVCDGAENCITYFRVTCWDWDEQEVYYSGAQCNTPAGFDECKSR